MATNDTIRADRTALSRIHNGFQTQHKVRRGPGESAVRIRQRLAEQLRHRSMFANQELRTTGEVRELRGGHIDAEALIERREHFTEVNGASARFLGPS